MCTIVKRDGRKEQFNKYKIVNAISKAFIAVDGKLEEYSLEKANKIADHIYNESLAKSNMEIEDIQDMVEDGLMRTKRKDVAKSYILYRDKRSKIRESNSNIMKIVDEKLYANNVQNQNANVDEKSFGGRKGEVDSAILKEFALENCMSKMSRDNYLNNEIYIHDLDSYALGMHNCLSVPFDDLLANGFNTRQTDVRAANSVNTAFQLIAVIFQLQSLNQFGGVSATHLDWTMVPYIRKSFLKHYIESWITDSEKFKDLNLMDMIFDDYIDDFGVVRNKYEEWVDNNKSEFFKLTGLTEEDFRLDNKDNLNPKHYQQALYKTINETKQAVEGMYHNLNTLQSRSGCQLPFTSINYGTCTSLEGRLIIRALLMGSLNGVGKFHKTSVFPCGIFQLGKGINREPGDPNYDLYQLALKSTAKRLYPNYVNIDWTGNEGYDPKDPSTYMSTMGCRTANGMDINGLGQLKDGRGNICPVTIILPTLAQETKDVNKFMDLLDKKINEAKDMLIERFDYICSQDPDSAKFMYENGLMKGYIPEEGIRSALKHGTLAIGQLGLAEALQILIGEDHTSEKGMELAKSIEGLFKTRCAEFKNKYKLNFGVYYTPAENLCFTALKRFRKKYGKIKDVSDKEFFTNSMHVPVWKEMSPFEKIDIESQLTGYSSAGCITYVELEANMIHNITALEQIVNYAMDKDIPYFAINVPDDTCDDCGYHAPIENECPKCGSKNISRLRRVTGYLTGNYKTAFNKGKQQEVEMRVKHHLK